MIDPRGQERSEWSVIIHRRCTQFNLWSRDMCTSLWSLVRYLHFETPHYGPLWDSARLLSDFGPLITTCASCQGQHDIVKVSWSCFKVNFYLNCSCLRGKSLDHHQKWLGPSPSPWATAHTFSTKSVHSFVSYLITTPISLTLHILKSNQSCGTIPCPNKSASGARLTCFVGMWYVQRSPSYGQYKVRHALKTEVFDVFR
jgi:hypothetical protein